MGTENWSRMGLYPQEILPVIEGMKPLLRACVYKENMGQIKLACRKEDLICRFYHHSPHNQKPNHFCYISKSKDILDEFFRLDDMHLKARGGVIFDDVSNRMGELLGYPKCCCKFFSDTVRDMMTGIRDKKPLVLSSLKNTNKKPSYMLNNLFISDSRFDYYNNHDDIYQSDAPIPFSFITHVPCSFDCEKSALYSVGVKEILLEKCPEVGEEIIYYLKNPVLFFDDINWLSLKGKVSANRILYEGKIAEVFENPEIPSLIGKGNEIEVNENEIRVSKNGQRIGSIRKRYEDRGVIIDFS